MLDALSQLTGGPVRPVRAVSGGDINRAAVVDCGNARCFLKWNAAAPPGFFAREAEGLDALSGAGAIRVPWPLRWAEGTDERPAFLLMQYIESGAAGPDLGRDFGAALAQVHGFVGARYGLERHNYIGTLLQKNPELDDWPGFWRHARLAPVLHRARRWMEPEQIDRQERLLEKLPELLPACPPASLLHGDLWSGNYLVDESGQPALIDPAVYRGDREVDLAMADLFGGFPEGFEDGYQGAWPLAPGWSERRPIYALYPILVHVALFGASYVPQADAVARQFV